MRRRDLLTGSGGLLGSMVASRAGGGRVRAESIPESAATKPASQRKRWFKGNLHMHSFWSDGHDFPEMITDWFVRNGYHFIAFTEHDCLQIGEKWLVGDPQTPQGRSLIEHSLLEPYVKRFGRAWVEQRERGGHVEVRLKRLDEYRSLFEKPGRFTMLTGEEITVAWGAGGADSTCYVNAFNLTEPVPAQQGAASCPAALGSLLAREQEPPRRQGRPVAFSLDHPNYAYAVTAEDIAAASGLRFMEVYTAHASCNVGGDALHASTDRIWDVVLAHRLANPDGELVYGLASDDCHAYTPDHHLMRDGSLPGRGWVCVRASELSSRHLVEAMYRGDFYASTGVTLDELQWDGRKLQIRIVQRPGERLVTQFIGSRKGYTLDSTPVRDEKGGAVRTTRQYGKGIGEVLQVSEGPEAMYQARGDEVYVRAVVRSSLKHPKPHRPGDVQTAWIQPVRVV